MESHKKPEQSPQMLCSSAGCVKADTPTKDLAAEIKKSLQYPIPEKPVNDQGKTQ